VEAVSTSTKESTDLGVDLDAPVVCEIFPPPGPCDVEAAWEARMACCGFSALLCDEHRRWSLDVIAAKTYTGLTLVCSSCDAPYAPPTWRPL
jgi:hypothetical protein